MGEVDDPANASESASRNFKADSVEMNSNGISLPATGTPESNTESQKPHAQNDIIYKVECHDRQDTLVKNFESDEPFDDLVVSQHSFQEQNEATSDLIKKGVVLEIVTHVNGSTLPGAHTSSDEHNALLPRTLKDFAISSKRPTTMIIRSQLLLKMIRGIVTYYPPQELTGDTVAIVEPFPVLMHHMDELANLLSELKAECAQMANEPKHLIHEKSRHLQVLLDYLQPIFKKVVRPAVEKLKRSTPVVTFDTLWYLYRPGADLYVKLSPKADERTGTGIMMHMSPERADDSRRREKEQPGMYVNYFKLQSNGVTMGRGGLARLIEYFEGEREVTALPIYPASFWDSVDGGERRRELEERGEHVFQIFRDGHRQMKFTGNTCSERKVYYENASVLVDDASALRYINEKVDVDFKTVGLLRHPLNTQKHALWDTYDNISIRKTSSLSKHQYFLMPQLVSIFVLKDKSWHVAAIDNLADIQSQEEVMRSLVLEDSNMEILQAVCQAHDHAWKIEFIENKGEGQIVLLHGPPGVGKTYTVESFAVASGRPLITLTVADIGLEDDRIENELAKWFSLAEIWNAILLLDEADIFMERRSRADIQRNALVSVFLRQMEYFKGVFFLTTNRVGHIDDAFLSRVAVIIGYDPLSDERRARIWNGFFAKLQKDMERRKQEGSKPIIQVSKYAKQYVLYDEEIKALEWNGREIRNALQTAISLARYRASREAGGTDDEVVDVEVDHFKSVMRMSKSFRGYMDSISKLPEAERAKRAWDRNDDFRHHGGER
ncbi:MAG: hypothetical protein M1821_005162 [Bathelium mastoideum]|nr:MAG: hypothetical protein M1821_005162 [Bathelium mastoideum]KAI9677814.1 MAG: hypothetical protein M1822_008126 [Bathelium mastoideum]